MAFRHPTLAGPGREEQLDNLRAGRAFDHHRPDGEARAAAGRDSGVA